MEVGVDFFKLVLVILAFICFIFNIVMIILIASNYKEMLKDQEEYIEEMEKILKKYQ